MHSLLPPSSLGPGSPLPPPPRPGLPARVEPGRTVTRRPLVAEEAPVRRLRASHKSGAGESGAVSMEERETEEAGRRSRRQSCSHRSAPPPCHRVWGKSCRCRRQCSRRRRRLLLLLYLAPGKDSPPRVGQCAGRGAGVRLCGGD